MNDLDFTTREGLEGHQLERVNELIEAISTNPFYGPRLREAGIAAGVASLDEFRQRMPFTRKSELVADQEANPPYGTNLTAPLERYVRIHQTSSTSGTPLRWLDTERGWTWLVDGWRRVLEASEVTPDDRVFLAFSFGPFIGLWLAFTAAERMGCLVIPGGALNSAVRARAIVANRATVLCCTPTYAARLGEVAREEGIDVSQGMLRTIIVGGEPGGSVPSVRKKIEDLWPGARVADHHGMTEAGPVTLSCPADRNHLHAIESAFLCEVVDPSSGEPLPTDADAPGELVLTTLGRHDSPVLRYRTGDLVHPIRPPCACGRVTLRLRGGLLARADQMIVVRGVNLYPSAIDRIVQTFGDVGEYRVEIGTRKGMTELELLIEPAPACASTADLCRQVEEALRHAYNLRIPVRIAPEGGLPRFELKAKRWIRV